MTAGTTAGADAPRTLAANQARRLATCRKLDQIEGALRVMRGAHTPITYPAVARRAGVSRTFLYQNPDARKLMATAITAASDKKQRARAEHDEQAEASWQQRALNAEDALKSAYSEIGAQRHRIAIIMGQIRDLQAEYGEDTVQRLAAENTTLKQRVRQLTDENRGLQEKLQAARSNNRFLDKRIADLEARLLDTATAFADPGQHIGLQAHVHCRESVRSGEDERDAAGFSCWCRVHRGCCGWPRRGADRLTPVAGLVGGARDSGDHRCGASGCGHRW